MLHFNPLIYNSIDDAHSYSAELFPEGLIGVVGSFLRIFTIPKLGVKVKQDSMPLSYTPQKMILDPATKNVITIEPEHGTVSPSEKAEHLAQHQAEGLDFDDEAFDDKIVGVPRADAGKWVSCIRIANPLEVVTLSKVDLDNNECATSVVIVSFAIQEGNSPVLVVGTAKDAFVQPRMCKMALSMFISLSMKEKKLNLCTRLKKLVKFTSLIALDQNR
ncbi:hypothetical protein BY996DRAFT_6417632 [Phakopsora pachyrhizi]|uniref:RSE1/DDB1/CPSF1 C-terminal domain-containing protein n=1 Tax=Phakopsora pachyrhizi TaxID=170000 RepID=A0AAV0BB84_PHAPC|nr:hypothetical protein BY996DRAFT_6417632 [Phakopsora pachyrhizi]CAH7682364.1 hypothetical protein PPACK8108_LOCUS15241 [Phakopsora pachyrhizi]